MDLLAVERVDCSDDRPEHYTITASNSGARDADRHELEPQ
jgi:hypothetical protein